jgi:RNA polymerase sigma-B factor
MEALVLSLRRFDPERGVPFLAFAKPTIVGTLRRHYRDTGWSVRVPRRVHELSGPLREATALLGQDLGRQPSAAEVADLLGVPAEDVAEVLAASRARSTRSLDDHDRAGGPTVGQLVGRDDAGLRLVEDRTALRQTLATLPAGDRTLLGRYFFDELTQTQIAAELGCSQMQVSRLLARALRRLRRRWGAR